MPREFTGKHMLWIMVTFFGAVILVNASLAYFAMSSWTGLVVPNSYVASQSFNKDTAARMEALQNGAAVSVKIEKGIVRLHFTGKQDEALPVENLAAMMRHPVDARKEVVLRFEAAGAGAYKSLTALPPGTWVGDIQGEIKGYGHWAEAVRFSVED